MASAQQALITSCARLSISGLPRCTESKSKSAVLVPVVMEEAALPPMPIRIPGPPSWINKLPGGKASFLICRAEILPKPPAIMMGL